MNHAPAADPVIAPVVPADPAPSATASMVTAFVDALNRSDGPALIRLFAEDALVNDQLRDFWGAGAIAGWIRREVVGERLRVVVVDSLEHYGVAIVTAHVSGDFDATGLPDPLVLSFHFAVHAGRIVRLVVLCNHLAESEPEIRCHARGGMG